ncbi:MAG: glycoside hydrolase family 47 protein [Bacteroidetes bacterium]|nr:glycoside hydrolase family 47 protein [Bacteroidota bacterium]
MVAPLGVLLSQTFTPEQKKAECDKIREACQFAWKGYKTYAWGYDALQPISKTGRNWYKVSLLMTPVDAYDTFILMGLKEEAAEAQGIIFEKLNFAVDMEVQLFEVSIRMLGGLLSSYELSHEKKFLDLAKDLGKRLLPAFRTPTGMPYRYVNLVTGETRDPASNPAEIGTYMLEFGKLTQLTGDSVYYKTAKKAAMEVFKRRSPVGLVGTVIDVKTGKWLNTESQIGARIDSYLEYLLKSWLLFGDKDFRDAWVTSQKAISHYLVQPMPYGWFMTRVDMKTGRETRSLYGALDAFCAGLMALAGDLNTAENLQKGNFYMWNRFNLEPEEFDFRKDTVIYGNYPLRPENIESCFYLYRLTKKEQYLNMGQSMINNILYHCRTEVGFAALKNVQTLEKEDDMESFFFAETLKYAYLLFAPESTLDLEKTVFTTEAHPLSVGGRQWAVGSGQ